MKRFFNTPIDPGKAAIRAFYLLLLACSLITGCKKFLVIPAPTNQLVTATVFASSNTATAAQTAIYQQMVNNAESYNMSDYNGMLSDEFTNYATDLVSNSFYHDAMNNSIAPQYGDWAEFYNYIYQANAIIAGLQNNSAIPIKIANQLTGESEVVRAFWYFYLVNMYGDVPLVLTTNYKTNESIARTPKAQVYEQMVADLKDAESKLNANYVDATDTTITTDRVRPNQAVAEALLARVYLYMGGSHYVDAATEATKVITNSTYHLVTPLTQADDGFNTSDNGEAIWQLANPLPAFLSGGTWDGFFYILTSDPSTVALSPQLINAFEPGDQRFNAWVGSYNDGSATYYFPFKYKVSLFTNNPDNLTEYTMVLRLAEQYLIRAEARAQQGKITGADGALADINVIRTRAGLANYAGGQDQASVLAAILHERQVELFSEWGNRWFDLIRTGKVNQVMTAVDPQKGPGVTWNPNSALYPIPLQDLKTNPQLKQNPGY